LQASLGSEALKISRDFPGPIHLMLTDIVMPEMSGYLLAQKLSVLRPEMRVLFMSGYSDETIRQHGEQNQDTPFIHKPFTPEGLNHKIRQVLDEKPVERN
jgi:YesN/AraC family two-component response regulator